MDAVITIPLTRHPYDDDSSRTATLFEPADTPVSKSLPYEWYDTPNVRCATIRDFEQLANQVGLQVLQCVALHEGKPVRFLPNLRGSLAVFRLKKK